MTTVAWILLGLAVAVALMDWASLVERPNPLEALAKPLVIVLLIGVALTLNPQSNGMRWLFIFALVFSLAGDVYLLPQVNLFVLGLLSFLLAHVVYVLGFLVGGVTVSVIPLAAAAVAVVAVPLLVVLARGARDKGESDLIVPVVVYVVVISAMVVAAVASGNGVAIAGALLFMTSDAVIGWSRFVKATPSSPWVIMITYHAGQALLVVSLTV